ncbi:hypothetical protein ABT264_19635 [Streptomyces virginiae]|uniref:hypothetical protein n=1 Tax=Streptomyces virginiae TaxID=1961 RepID=UPI003324B750
MSDWQLTAHPNAVMEPDGQIRAWSAEDTRRVEEAVQRLLWSAELAKRAHAYVHWLTIGGNG